jgi:hypothetical protein
MSAIHILDANGDGQFRVVIHTPVPTGNNSAGLAWKAVLLASGRSGSTVLTEGIGPGQISTAEKATIVAGDVMEIVESIPLEGGGATQASIVASATSALNAWKVRQQAELRRYGQVVA